MGAHCAESVTHCGVLSHRRDKAMQSDATSPLPAAARPQPLLQVAQLPGPRGIPLFGNALQVYPAQFHLQLEQWARDFGPVYQLRLMKATISTKAMLILI